MTPSGHFRLANPQIDEKDRLRLLSTASLFGGEFTIDWLVELTDLKANQILAELQPELDRETLSSPYAGIYCFQNLAGFDQLQNEFSAEEKADLHRRIADLLIRDLPESNHKLPWISQHLLHVAVNDVDHCRLVTEAGDIYRHSFRNEQALQCYAKVMDDLAGNSEMEADRLFTETAIKYSKISTARHETNQVLAILNDALVRALRQGNRPAQALVEMHIAKNEWMRARYDRAIKHFNHGWKIAKDLDDPHLLSAATPFGTLFLYWQGLFRDAVNSYEKSLPDIEKYPERSFPLLGAITVGYCYAQTGRLTQGLGMLDAIRSHCLDIGNNDLAAIATGSIGETMLILRRIDEAQDYIEKALEMASGTQNRWIWVGCQILMAFIHHSKGEKKKALHYLRRFQEHSKGKNIFYPYPSKSYLLEMCQAIESGDLPKVAGFSLGREVGQSIRSKNFFLKGMGYRYHAGSLARKSAPVDRIVSSYRKSIKYLSLSGHEIELARSRLELARFYLTLGLEDQAKELILDASRVLSAISESLIPNDLKRLIDQPAGSEHLLKDILELGRQVVNVRNNRDLVQHIIAMVSRVTGAERGAIFLVDENGPEKGGVRLRASKNLTVAEVDHPSFGDSIALIEEVACTGQGMIRGAKTSRGTASPSQGHIRSMICVPMILHNRVVGVLYHDNRLLSSAFKEPDIEILSYFAALAAIALDNADAHEEIKRLNQKLHEEKNLYKEEYPTDLHFKEIVGRSQATQKVILQIEQVAATAATVLITGETGVGKELIARAIHNHSPRRNKPFISVQLNSLTDNLIPSELFGHEKGAFTGATQRRIGRFELADGGTLFLDEIGDLPEDIQIRLLRILQTRQFERVGGTQRLTSDFRLITATNRNLHEAVKEGRFRADLFYRLNVFLIHVPPVRERKEDIPLLVRHFLDMHAKKIGKRVEGISKPEMEKLMQYNWPGNVRELENVVERGVILSPGPFFCMPELDAMGNLDVGMKVGDTLAEMERWHILKILKKTGWKISGPSGAARVLDIHPSTLYFRMNRLGIRRGDLSWGEGID